MIKSRRKRGFNAKVKGIRTADQVSKELGEEENHMLL